ncbi:MAG TPA: cellulose biosynthesis protein BcsS, partial [Allosphingosinicella sp.]|nr:cellulose biosynthesis protein BcsS [Allosphingosinicella sp.]
MRSIAVAAAAMSLLLPQAGSAQTYKGVAFAGVSTGRGTSGYAGATVALPGGSLGKGLAVRGATSLGDFTFERNGTDFDGEYFSAEVALVSQHSGPWGWANFSAGPRINDLEIEPPDPDNDRVGTRLDLGVQTDGGYNINPAWRATWRASSGVFNGTYQVRGTIGRLVDQRSPVRLGLDAGFQGSPEYS